jgi:hypothetical protein
MSQGKVEFFQRTGKNAAARSNNNMDIVVEGITLYAGQVGGPGGGEELIDRGTLKLTYGVKYGMVGRNGVGKSTFLRAVSRHPSQSLPSWESPESPCPTVLSLADLPEPENASTCALELGAVSSLGQTLWVFPVMNKG